MVGTRCNFFTVQFYSGPFLINRLKSNTSPLKRENESQLQSTLHRPLESANVQVTYFLQNQTVTDSQIGCFLTSI